MDIDIHTIPENKNKEEGSHIHIDFCYAFQVEEPLSTNDNELPFDWISIEEVKDVRRKRWRAILKSLKTSV